MIQLNVDYVLLNKYFGVSTSKIYSNYANKSFEEIMKIEAQNGNEKAENYEDILSNPQKIIEIFGLCSIENRYIILQNMAENDLDALLPLLTPEQLAVGLNFFNEDKLIQMTKELPIEEIIGIVFEKFTLYDVLNLMEDSAMDAFLREPDVKRDYSQNYFNSLQQNQLQTLMVKSFGAEYKEKSKDEILEELQGLSDNDFNQFTTGLERKDTIELINGIVAQDENLLLLFKPDDLVAPMELLMKSDKIAMMSKLDSEFLIPMIQELPVDLTQIVLTQIDPVDFAEQLSGDFQDVLKEVVLFKTG